MGEREVDGLGFLEAREVAGGRLRGAGRGQDEGEGRERGDRG
jgi:hypothetical protein